MKARPLTNSPTWKRPPKKKLQIHPSQRGWSQCGSRCWSSSCWPSSSTWFSPAWRRMNPSDWSDPLKSPAWCVGLIMQHFKRILIQWKCFLVSGFNWVIAEMVAALCAMCVCMCERHLPFVYSLGIKYLHYSRAPKYLLFRWCDRKCHLTTFFHMKMLKIHCLFCWPHRLCQKAICWTCSKLEGKSQIDLSMF